MNIKHSRKYKADQKSYWIAFDFCTRLC